MQTTVVIGAGQAGLAMSQCLQRQGVPHLVLESNTQVGDNWRQRWDSLSLFSPAAYNNLPGMEFPGPRLALPTRDQAADYLAAYARHFALPVQTDTRVLSLSAEGKGFLLRTSRGEIRTANAVVATGPYTVPHLPACAAELPSHILQLHSSRYRNPGQLQDGPALVVGAGASGSQIAGEIAATRKTYLAGRDTGAMPRAILGLDIYWWLYRTGAMNIRWDSFLGRKLIGDGSRGDTYVGEKLDKIIRRTGIQRLGRLSGTDGDALIFDPGERIAEIRNVVWATGYRQDFSWIRLPVFREDGLPRHRRGVVEEAPGLFFLGLKTLYRVNSSLMGGVGRDAQYLAKYIAGKGD